MSCFLHNIIGTIYMYYYIFYFDWNFFIPKLIFPKTKMFSSRKIYGLMFQNRPFVFKGEKTILILWLPLHFFAITKFLWRSHDYNLIYQFSLRYILPFSLLTWFFLVQYAYMYIECKTIWVYVQKYFIVKWTGKKAHT